MFTDTQQNANVLVKISENNNNNRDEQLNQEFEIHPQNPCFIISTIHAPHNKNIELFMKHSVMQESRMNRIAAKMNTIANIISKFLLLRSLLNACVSCLI